MCSRGVPTHIHLRKCRCGERAREGHLGRYCSRQRGSRGPLCCAQRSFCRSPHAAVPRRQGWSQYALVNEWCLDSARPRNVVHGVEGAPLTHHVHGGYLIGFNEDVGQAVVVGWCGRDHRVREKVRPFLRSAWTLGARNDRWRVVEDVAFDLRHSDGGAKGTQERGEPDAQ
eukprot:scaffold1260_cov343-Prasinococcus_capsulatus_cf.AAC.3